MITRHLERVGKSLNTVKASINDFMTFTCWFEETTARESEPKVTDPRDTTEYRGFLPNRGRRPATINSRMSALNRFFQGTKREYRIDHSSFEILERVYAWQENIS